MVDATIINLAKKFLKLLAQNGIPVQRAFLYGSYVRNEAGPKSDIDIMLVSDYFDTTDIYKMARPWRFAAKVDYRIEPVSVSSQRFLTDDSSPLIATVKKEGIEIAL
jgi:predicted nucleotidyltransferase